MAFTDIFIKRPVLATVVSLLILLIGAQAGFKLPIRQYPELSNTTITVMTSYPGANADLIQGFITVPIQQAVASAEGIDTLVATSTQNVSTVTLNLKLDADPDRAMTDVVIPVITRFAPTWLIISSGFDAHRADPITDLGLSSGDYGPLTSQLLALVAPSSVPCPRCVVSVGDDASTHRARSRNRGGRGSGTREHGEQDQLIYSTISVASLLTSSDSGAEPAVSAAASWPSGLTT